MTYTVTDNSLDSSVGGNRSDDMYLRGLLVANVPGGSYQGIIYDRSLRLQLEGGLELDIIDDSYPAPPISQHLPTGHLCELLVMATLGTATTYSPQSPGTPHHGTLKCGIIEQLAWFPPHNPSRHYRHFSPRLYHNGGGFTLVRCKMGHVLFGPDDICPANGEYLQPKGYVQWQRIRLELLAIR